MADSVPGNMSSTTGVAVGGTVTGTIETPGDHDWYRVSLIAGRSYSFVTSATDATDIDTFLTLRDAAGATLASDDDGGHDGFSRIVFTATTTGTYFADVGSYGDQTTGGFRLAVNATAAPPGDTVPNDTTSGVTLTVGQSLAGTLESNGDHDWYRVVLSAGQTYVFSTAATGGGADPDTILAIRGADGGELAYNDDGSGAGTYSTLRFTPSATGTYFVDVASYGESERGAYRLSMATGAALTVWSNDQIADQLASGYWGGRTHRFDVAAGGALTYSVAALSAGGQDLARAALRLWNDATGIVFREVASNGQIAFSDDQSGAFTSAVYSNGVTTSARVNVSTQWLSDYGSTITSYSFQTYVHEIGHALGLGHAGEYNSTADYPADALYLNDHWGTSIMSYFSQSENDYAAGQGLTRQFQLTPTAADAIATTTLYGTVVTANTGDTRYGFASTAGSGVYNAQTNPAGGYTVFDGGGIDTLDYSGFAQAQVVDLRAESLSNVGGRVGNVAIARGAVIENAIGGAGADRLIGNAADNRLTGGGGSDTLMGGAGNDTYMVDDARTSIVEAAGEGSDTAVVSAAAGAASWTLSAGAEVELLQAASGAAAINITGNGLAQRIEGNAGANILNGGGGNDTLVGFGGDDTYLVRELGSVVIEGNGGGSDTVYTTVSYNLGVSEVEVLSTVEHVATTRIDLIGNFATQYVVGNYGDNVLNGGSGGNDTLIGLRGNDVYAAGSQSIAIVENANEGTDTLVVFADYQIRNGASIEVFAAQNRGGSEALTLRGNEVAQTIVGNAGANVIDGRAGSDTLVGDGGADVFAFTTAPGTGNVDAIVDFGNGADRIALASDVFAAVTGGGIAAGEFVTGTAATDADDRLIYDQAGGRLFYDADGTGAGAAIQFAQLAPGTALSAASFTVIAPVADLTG